jgi:4-amino-4-deoxy-L-arabinose transferase-like glycosyltransferase
MPTLFGSTRAYAAVLLGLFAVIFFYATYKLTESPPTWYDEGIYIQVAHSFAENGTQSVQVAPGEFKRIEFLTVGFPVIAPVAASIKMFGYSVFAARIPMVIFILLFAASVWWLMYRLAGPREALLSLLLVATFPLLYGNGKNVLGEIPGLLFSCLSLIALYRLELDNFKGAKNYFLLGLAAGLTAASKPVFLLLPGAIAIVLIFRLKKILPQWKDMLVGPVTFIALMALWTYLQFGPDASLSAILAYYLNPYGVASVSATMLENLVRLFTEDTPLYCTLLMSVWIVSIAVRIYRKRSVSLAEYSAFVFSALVLIAYLRTAGWYRYFFETLAMALILAPLSLKVIAQEFRKFFPERLVLATPIAGVFLLTALQLYELNVTSWVATHYHRTTVADMAKFFDTWPDDKSIFVYNSPEAPNMLGTGNYYQYMQPTETIAYGADQLQALKDGVPDYVLVAAAYHEKYPEFFSRYEVTDAPIPYLLLSRK